MMRLRAFRNDDPPALAEIWRHQPANRGLVRPISEVMWDELVLSKPYFDRPGLIIAEEEGRPIGFAHAAFGPNADGTAIDRSSGSTCLLMVTPSGRQEEVGRQLLGASEEYLRSRGAAVLYAGCSGQRAPYYHGMYGGTTPPGILGSDPQHSLFRRAGYEPVEERLLLERRLDGFRPPINREILRLRREYRIERGTAPPPTCWWDACTWGQLDVVRFDLTQGRDVAARLLLWDMEPLASSWGKHAAGLLDWHVERDEEGLPLIAFLLGEMMREVQSQGVALVEIQVPRAEVDLGRACHQLGFEQVDRGVCFRKRH